MVERKNGKGNRKGNGNGHRAPAKLEYFWLCSECALHYTLETERDSGVVRVTESNAVLQSASPR